MVEFLKRWGPLLIIGGGVLALDQWVKQRVLTTLAEGQSWAPIPAIADVFRITRSQNAGAAFGMFPFASDFFLVLAILTIIAFVVSYPRLPSHAWLSRISIALISGGALSNAIDRLRHGHVVDYFHVQLSTAISNVSNFADHAITLGVILLLIDQWRAERRELAEEQARKAEAESNLPGESSPEHSPSPDPSAAGSEPADNSPSHNPDAAAGAMME